MSYALKAIRDGRYVQGFREDGLFSLTSHLDDAQKFSTITSVLCFVSRWSGKEYKPRYYEAATPVTECGAYDIVKVAQAGWREVETVV